MPNPLTIHHEKLGARFDPGSVPLSYTNPVEEYWSLRKGVGITDLSHFGRLTVTGMDRISFLNGLLTNDANQLKDNQGQRSALLNTKARVLADLHIYKYDDSILVDTGNSPSSRVKEILDRYIITEDVQTHDSTQDLVQLTIQGPKAVSSLKEILGKEVQELKPLQHTTLGPSLIISRDRTGLGGYDIILPKDESEALWQGFLLKGGEIGLQPVGLTAMEIFRLEAGQPKYGLDIDENTIVLEAGYKEAISYTKGCYIGQEVVARATHIGRVNKQLVQLEIDSPDPPAMRTRLINDGKEAGYLTSAAFSPGLVKTVALGYANRDFAREGTRLAVKQGPSSVPAIVTRIV